MTPTIVEAIERPPDHLVDTFRGTSAADIHEAMNKSGGLDPSISPVTSETELCGPAVTVHLPEGDNMMIHLAAKLAEPGDVIVIAANTTRAATWGELATRNAIRNDIEGVVSDGNVRDIERIEELGFPVFSRAVSQIGATKNTPGSVNVPISVGNVTVTPGDIVVGDSDGVTVVPQRHADTVVTALHEKTEREAKIRDRLDQGDELFDVILGSEELAKYDIKHIEGPVDYSNMP